MKYNKIALVGLMGTGKTLIAKLLASKLKLELFEADEIFEKENNIKIKDFFKNFGEVEFRKKETDILKNIIKKDNFILSTGGGVVLDETNRKLLFNKDVFSIYLSTSPKVIFERIKGDKTRPLLMVHNPEIELEKILSEREKYYNLATIKITTDNKTPDEIIEEILNYE